MIGRKKVAILGGAFDPIHNDHLNLAQSCLNETQIDEVWLTPTPSKRWDKQTQYDSDQRQEWVRLAIAARPKLYLCSLEIEWGVYRGAFVFIQKLKVLYPNIDFYLMMGSDSYEGILEWRDPLEKNTTNGRELIANVPIVLYAREGYDLPSEKVHQKRGGLPWIYLPTDSKIGDLSSTHVRAVLSQKELQTQKDSLSQMVPQEIVNSLLSAD